MKGIMGGEISPPGIAAFVTALKMKGETVQEITGCARAMRQQVVRVQTPRGVIMDTCGTGGDGAGTFNISTISAIVLASAGVKIAKHGNRAASSNCGSADLLEALGLNIELGPKVLEKMLKEVGIIYMHAPLHHPAMKHAMPVRRALGFRTVFNLLGPLCNPASANTQTLGVYSPDLVFPFAKVLSCLGVKNAYVCHGAGGLDEFSTLGVNRVARLHKGQVRRMTIMPGSVGIKRAKLSDLKGGSPKANAAIARSILAGKKGAPRDAVLFNVGMGLTAAGKTPRPKAGVDLAAQLIDSGAAKAKLEEWVKATQEAAG